jgi:hypothetical protein
MDGGRIFTAFQTSLSLFSASPLLEPILRLWVTTPAL